MTTIQYRVDFGRPRRPVPRQNKADAASPPAPELPPREKHDPRASAAELLAVAHFVERGLIDGSIPTFQDAAVIVGVSRVRLSQIMNLLDLSPEIQNAVLLHTDAIAERALRMRRKDPVW